MNCIENQRVAIALTISLFLGSFLLLMSFENGFNVYKIKVPELFNLIEGSAIQEAESDSGVINYGTSVVFSSDDGRLGNQLSSYSDLLSLEWDFGVRAFLDDFQYKMISLHFESHELNRTVRILSDEFPDKSNIKWVESYPPHPKADWPPKKFGAFYHAGLYLNHIKNYYKYLPRLKKIFQFKKFLLNEAKLRLQEVRDKAIAAMNGSSTTNFTFVSIHSRRTDYAKHLKILFNLNYVDTSYYYHAIEFYKTKLENPIFYVLSDDIEWADKEFTNSPYNLHVMHNRTVSMEGNVTLTENDNIGIDLALLSLANHSIISYGTFAAWGAFLSGGLITMPLSHSKSEETALLIKKADLTNVIFI